MKPGQFVDVQDSFFSYIVLFQMNVYISFGIYCMQSFPEKLKALTSLNCKLLLCATDQTVCCPEKHLTIFLEACF